MVVQKVQVNEAEQLIECGSQEIENIKLFLIFLPAEYLITCLWLRDK